MSYQADNAVILAAGLSSRFAPISYEMPKALTPVRGEVLIERQIRQLREAGIDQVIVVTGYKAEMFEYLKEKLGVILVHNGEYQEKNNHSSIYAVREYLKNTYICCGDNYLNINPFEKNVEQSYYSALYAAGETDEWCMETDGDGIITSVKIGGRDAWYMNGPAFWSEEFSRTFLDILEEA
ncbi:NTP transferase domain-containing protein, partial [Blautia pseudococcoides]|nr:NTP transferase domain-containing protein [Blautia pseudococcoides]